MDRLLKSNRLPAALTALFFWLLAAAAYSGIFAQAATGKARAVHLLIDVMVVGLLGKFGAAVLFGLLGTLAVVAAFRVDKAA